MTLIVQPYRRLPTGAEESLEVDPQTGRNDLFGFEACRTILWGADVVRALGLELLPTLAEYDILAEREHLDELEAEARILLANLATVSAATTFAEDFIEFRLLNLLEAVRCARLVEDGRGGVYVG